MDFLRKTASIFILSVLCLLFLPAAAYAVEHIYVDQETVENSSSTTGAENDPFKSITYAVLVADSRGLPDGWEVDYGLNPLVNDAGNDPNGDGWNNLHEYQKETEPDNPNSHPTRAKPWLMLLLGD